MIWVDSSEPENIELLLNQSLAGQTDRQPLNAKDLSDYYMVSYDAESLQFSRKQAGELLSDIDEAERQIRDYYCLHPSTKVLTADLEWKPLAEIQIGEALVGIDEMPEKEQGYHRKLRKSFVVDKHSVTKEAYIIIFGDDQEVIASAEHRWLQVGKKQSRVSYQRTDWTRTDELQPGMKLRYLAAPWDYDSSREAGYLAAAFNGEGTIYQHLLEFYQNPGEFLNEVTSSLHAKHYDFRTRKHGQCGVIMVAIGKLGNRIRFLGSIRPIRLMSKAQDTWENKEPQQNVEIYGIVSLGPTELINITTTTHTFIAEGLITHNCNADHNFQICEGLITPMLLYLPKRGKKGFVPSITSDASIRHLSAGGLYSYSVSATGWIGDEMAHKISGKMFYAWIYQLEQCGVPTFFTINYIETAKLLVAIHDNIQKSEHTTLQRYIKPRLAIKKKPKLLIEPYDLQVMTLMGVQGARIGEKTAKALVARFEDTYGVATATVEELTTVPGIAKKYAQTIFDAFRVYTGLDK